MARPVSDPTPALHALRPGARVGAVVSTYHVELTRAMAASARRVLVEAGLDEDGLLVLEVGGAFELPLVARRLAVRDDVDAVMCFGLVLKGETSHDLHIAQAAAAGIQRAAMETDTPVLFGVLTCDTLEQARARATPASEGGRLDKGAEVARAALAAMAAMRAAPGLGRAPRAMGFQA
jgi:6,7-dimethyl-8-ribityllumazine synthase